MYRDKICENWGVVMFYIWWPTYIAPGLMVLAGFAGRLLPGRKYRSPQGPLAPERQKFADALLLKLLWQFGLAFAALSFMIMRSVRLMDSGAQHILLYIAVILQIIGTMALILPVERNLKAYFDDQEDET